MTNLIYKTKVSSHTRTHQYAAAAVAHAGARLLRPTISRPSPPCRRHPCAMKPKARPLTSSAVPPRDAAALPSTRAAGGARSVQRGGRARAPARWRGGTSVSLSSPPARRRRAWWLSRRKPVARASSPQTGCGRGIYLRDLECHVDPAI